MRAAVIAISLAVIASLQADEKPAEPAEYLAFVEMSRIIEKTMERKIAMAKGNVERLTAAVKEKEAEKAAYKKTYDLARHKTYSDKSVKAQQNYQNAKNVWEGYDVQLKILNEALANERKLLKDYETKPTFPQVNLRPGIMIFVGRKLVRQVIDAKTAIIAGDVWLEGVDAAKLTDGNAHDLNVFVYLDGTKTYATALGSQKTIFHGTVVDSATIDEYRTKLLAHQK